MSDVTFPCQIMKDDPNERSIAIADGTLEARPGTLFKQLKWFFISRDHVLDCEPPLDALPTSGARMVRLTIPEWLALDRGLV